MHPSRFRLRTLMIVVAVAAVALGVMRSRRRWEESKQEALIHAQAEARYRNLARIYRDSARESRGKARDVLTNDVEGTPAANPNIERLVTSLLKTLEHSEEWKLILRRRADQWSWEAEQAERDAYRLETMADYQARLKSVCATRW